VRRFNWLPSAIRTALFGSGELNLGVSGETEQLVLESSLKLLQFGPDPGPGSTGSARRRSRGIGPSRQAAVSQTRALPSRVRGDAGTAAICLTCSGVWVRALFAYGTRSAVRRSTDRRVRSISDSDRDRDPPRGENAAGSADRLRRAVPDGRECAEKGRLNGHCRGPPPIDRRP
jgi:hypothetical protein